MWKCVQNVASTKKKSNIISEMHAVVLKMYTVKETKIIFLFDFTVFLGAFNYNYIANILLQFICVKYQWNYNFNMKSDGKKTLHFYYFKMYFLSQSPPFPKI